MDKHQLLDKIKNIQNVQQSEKDKILGWVQAMPNGVSKVKPSVYKIGDVFLHPIFLHPYVLFQKKGNEWICGLLTSESECSEILEQCESRFFDTNYFTKVIFTAKEPIGAFMASYDNNVHLKKVYKQLKEIFA